MLRFAVLGPMAVDLGDGVEPIALSAGIPRTVLATLLLSANTVVSTDRLMHVAWPDGPPKAAIESLRNHVLRLRRQLGPVAGARIRTSSPGYLIEVAPGEVDEHEFTEQCEQGRRSLSARDWAAAAETLAGALDLWRGRPFADVPVGPENGAEIQRLTETRLLALEGRIKADLHLGRHRETVAELRNLAAAHPLREEFHSQLMLALYRSNRQAEALQVFQDLRRALVDELGVEPAASVCELQHRVLRADPSLMEPGTGTGPGSVARRPSSTVAEEPDSARPRFQLPADTGAFTGRAADLDRLTELAREVAGGGPAGTVVISAIDGMGGIGKTALHVPCGGTIEVWKQTYFGGSRQGT